MEISKKFEELLQEEQQLKEKYKALLNEVAGHDLVERVDTLEKNLKESKQVNKTLQERLEKSQSSEIELRQTLMHQFLEEKLALIAQSKEKMLNYFGASETRDVSLLTAAEKDFIAESRKIEASVKKSVDNIRDKYKKLLSDLESDFMEECNVELDKRKKERNISLKAFSAKLEKLEAEEVDEKKSQNRLKMNRLEMNFGLKIISAVAAVLILVGSGFLFASFENKAVSGTVGLWLLSAILTCGGGFYYFKKRNIAGSVITGIGFAVLYTAFMFMFGTDLISQGVFLGFVFFVSACIVAVSILLKSKTFLSYGLGGGVVPVYFFIFYLSKPDFTLGSVSIVLLAYLFILQIAVSVISGIYRWNIQRLVSWVPVVPAVVMLCSQFESEIAGILSLTAFFLLFQIGIIVLLFIRKVRLNNLELISFLGNTIVYSSLLYYFVFPLNEKYGAGYTSLGLFLFFGIVACLIGISKNDRRSFYAVFSVSSVFLLSLIGFFAGFFWLPFGVFCLVLAVAVSGLLLDDLFFLLYSLVLFVAGVLYFFIYDYFYLDMTETVFDFNLFYIKGGLIFVVSLIIFLTAIIKAFKNKDFFLKYLKTLTVLKGVFYGILNTFLFFTAYYIFYRSPISYSDSLKSYEFYSLSIFLCFAVSGCGRIFNFIPRFKVAGNDYYSLISLVLGVLFYIAAVFSGEFLNSAQISGSMIASLVVLGVCVFYLAVMSFIELRNLFYLNLISYHLVWLLFAVCYFVLSSLYIGRQITKSTSIVLAVNYAVAAMLYIIVGFKWKTVLIRLAGLVQLLLAGIIAAVSISWNYSFGIRAAAFIVLGFLYLAVVLVYSKFDGDIRLNKIVNIKDKKEKKSGFSKDS